MAPAYRDVAADRPARGRGDRAHRARREVHLCSSKGLAIGCANAVDAIPHHRQF